MNVKYLGTRPNKRDYRGRVTGKRYRFSSIHPTFTIDPADREVFDKWQEDGKPMFMFVDSPSEPLVVVDIPPELAALMEGLLIKELPDILGPLNAKQLAFLFQHEANTLNRTGAKKAIAKMIKDLDDSVD